jgi:hypothetical protein
MAAPSLPQTIAPVRNQKKCSQGGKGATVTPFWHDYFQPARKVGRDLSPPKYFVPQQKLIANAPENARKRRKTPENTGKCRKTLENTGKRQKMLENATKRRIMQQNTGKRCE